MWSGTKKKRREEGSSYKSSKPAHKQTAESAKRRQETIQRFTSNNPPDVSARVGPGLGLGGGYASSKSSANAEHLGETNAEHPEPDGLSSQLIEPARFSLRVLLVCSSCSEVLRSAAEAPTPLAH